MKRDMSICKRIMWQFAQNGQFSAVTQEEAYHVALLKDKGFVEAQVECNAAGTPIKATIGRLTSNGHDALEIELNTEAEGQEDLSTIKEYYKRLLDIRHDNEVARDKMLATIATGGIGLLFAISSYLKINNISLPLFPWFMTLAAWTLVLMGLMYSCHLGGTSIDEIIRKLPDANADVMHKRGKIDYVLVFLNVWNCVSALIGVASFTWFLIKIV